MQGKFIVIEGCDGAGTTTQASLVKDALVKRGIDVTLSAEPTEYPTGKLIRQLLSDENPPNAKVFSCLFAADRYNHVEKLKPILEAGTWVVCDRYVHSSIVYQHFLGGVELGFVLFANVYILSPDMAFILNVTEETAWNRLNARDSARDIFEKKESIAKIVEGYKVLPVILHEYKDILIQRRDSQRLACFAPVLMSPLVSINGEKTKEEVRDQILQEINGTLVHSL